VSDDADRAIDDALTDLKDLIEMRVRREQRVDQLNGLPNNVALDARVHEVITVGCPYWIAFVEVDRFKSINDQFGYSAARWASPCAARTAGRRSLVRRCRRWCHPPCSRGFDRAVPAAFIRAIVVWLDLTRGPTTGVAAAAGAAPGRPLRRRATRRRSGRRIGQLRTYASAARMM